MDFVPKQDLEIQKLIEGELLALFWRMLTIMSEDYLMLTDTDEQHNLDIQEVIMTDQELLAEPTEDNAEEHAAVDVPYPRDQNMKFSLQQYQGNTSYSICHNQLRTCFLGMFVDHNLHQPRMSLQLQIILLIIILSKKISQFLQMILLRLILLVKYQMIFSISPYLVNLRRNKIILNLVS